MTVGERLREARERQKVSLHAIAEKTNISVRFLDAIEKNQFDKLPGGIFTRGFIRSYAAQVGLEPDALVTQFLSDEPGQRDDDIDEAPAKLAGDGPSLGTLVLAGLGVILLALALVFLLKPDWLGLQAAAAPQATTPIEPVAAPSLSQGVPAAGPMAEAAPPAAMAPASLAETATSSPSSAATTDAVPGTPKSPLRLVVAPSGRCWVQVSADGQMRLAREVTPGERITVDAAERLQIVVGDAGSFAYELNERPGRPLGAAGRVARATILPSTIPQFQTP
ncbi:helix-turn-helix domain-containing protein [Luteitalea sp.]